MRIYYLVPGPMGPKPEGSAEMNRRVNLLRQYAAPGTEVAIGDVQAGPYSIESVYEEYLSIPATVQRAVALEEAGWDALILGCYGDPGLDAFRELVSVPVVGPGEATALVAASLGYRFSVITVTKSVIIPMKRQIRNVGVGDKLASVRAVDIPVLQLNHDRAHTIEVALAEGRRAISDDGADTIILGCMSMGFLEIADELADALGVPVLDPGRVSLKYAEALVGAGLTHSRLAYMLPPKLASGEATTARDLLQGIA